MILQLEQVRCTRPALLTLAGLATSVYVMCQRFGPPEKNWVNLYVSLCKFLSKKELSRPLRSG